MSSSVPRYCSTCGNVLAADAKNCARCGAAVAAPATGYGAGASYGYGAPAPGGTRPSRTGLPGWVIGVLACVVAGPVLLFVCGIVAAIAIPNYLKYEARTGAAQAEQNLRAIWTAEQAWSNSHNGDYVTFDIDQNDQSDPEFKKLGVTLSSTLQHSYSAYYLGSTLWITATGNVDEDAFLDEWELSSDDPTPFHFSDDVDDTSQTSRQPQEDEDYEGSTEEGGVVGGVVGGMPEESPAPGTELTESQKKLEMLAKSDGARENLEVIFRAEKAYRAKHKAWMAFEDGSGATWAALNVTLPHAADHRYTANVRGDRLVLRAEGNLDDDDFEDVWSLDSSVGWARQEKSDLLNLDTTRLPP